MANDSGAHSSYDRSTEHTANADHAQSDDSINDIPVSQDPNISGNAPTLTPHPHGAGRLSPWRDNDDYNEFFLTGRTPDSALVRDGRAEWRNADMDNDYDDNGGIPTLAVPRDVVDEQIPIGLNALIIRRV